MSSRRASAAVLLACALAVGGCGGGDDGQDGTSQTPPEARPDQFPRAEGRTLAELRRDLPKGGPVLAPTVSRVVTGKNRLGFGLFTTARAQIADASAAIYVAPAGGGEAVGPFVAHYESLAVKSPYLSESTSKDPDAAKTLYVAEVPFKKPGRYEVLGMARLDDRLVAATSAVPKLVVIREKSDPVPGPGDRPPAIHTPTRVDVAGDLTKIDTRNPPDDMHEVDFADQLGKKPIVLLFATPLLCQSRVCGPVVDVAAQVEDQYRDQADFIHMEIFNDNEVAKGPRPQVGAFNLPSEPWVFTIDRHGKVAARIEGAFSVEELEAAVKKALQN
ncbi:MAG TPA: hypothetical protein VE686_03045 [Beijerinckiaceae bacterium]|nr:hypothetical protein [Beijerinckiaceae bacterium]